MCTALVQYGKLTAEQKQYVSKLVLNENTEIRKAALYFVDYGILDDSLIKNTDHKKHQVMLVNFVEFIEQTFVIYKDCSFET